MHTPSIYIGADVSKDELVIALYTNGRWQKQRVVNTLSAIAKWLSSLDKALCHIVLEATGPYCERLIHALGQQGFPFSVVNPMQSRAMAHVLGKSLKNDEQDANTLALLGEKMKPILYRMPTESEKKRKEAFSALASLQKQEQQLRNQLHAFSYRVNPNEVAVNALQTVLTSVREQIQQLQQEVETNLDEEEQGKTAELICSIKGVGKTTALTFIALYGDFKAFDTAKKFIKMLGLCPSEFLSGSSVRGKSSITKKGRSKVRALLFNCARSAIQHNPACKAFYQSLIARGKAGKVALTAVMQKIARLIYGVVRSGKPYDPDFSIA